MTAEELNFYKTLDITVRFNDKAWSDEVTAMEALVDFRKQTLNLGEVLLGMDGHKRRSHPSFVLLWIIWAFAMPSLHQTALTSSVPSIDTGGKLSRKKSKSRTIMHTRQIKGCG